MNQPNLSRDSHVVLLLASHLGDTDNKEAAHDRLGPAGWQDLANNISNSPLQSPGNLLRLNPEEWPDELWTNQIDPAWVEERLERATQLAMKITDLNDRGIWVTTKYEQSYPSHLAETLGRKAPPFLYISGSVAHLSKQAVGFVGSRDSTDQDHDYTRDLVRYAMDEDYAIVSGGARGIDETSEMAGLEIGGPVIEFPAEGLINVLDDTTVREAVKNDQLTLASHYYPQASWNVGAAMGRNKLIHGFGRYTVVVRSGDETGGTWEGATENLDNNWSSLLVCDHDKTPAGNRKLIQKGGVAIDPTAIPAERSFEEWVQEQQSASKDGNDLLSESQHQQSSLDQFE